MAPLIFGVERNSEAGHFATWIGGNVTCDRGITNVYNNPGMVSEAVAEVGAALAKGFARVVFQLGCEQKLLSEVSASGYGKALKEVVKALEEAHPGKVVYELINEPYFCGPHQKSNASDYAAIIKAAYEEVEALGLPKMPTLLVAGFLTYERVNGSGVGLGTFSDYTAGAGWLKDILTAWPTAATKINGFTSHPYGEPKVAATGEGNNNIRAAKLQHEQAVALGYAPAATSNWWITEIGYYDKAHESGEKYTGFGAVATEAEQSGKLKEALEEVLVFHEEGWCVAVSVFTDHEGEGWNIWGRTAQATLTTFAEAHGTEVPIPRPPVRSPSRQAVFRGMYR